MQDKTKSVQLVLCWHMHQPEYRDRANGQYRLPWTYLHAIKDYVDMVAHLEMVPGARAVINFAPILLEQIENYALQISLWLSQDKPISDPLLNALASENIPGEKALRISLVSACLKANRTRMIDPWPVYKGLVRIATWMEEQNHAIDYISDQFLIDLLVWYHLVWMGETIRRSDVRIKRLIEKGTHFSFQDRRILLEVIGENLARLLGRYKVLASQERIEISITPYGHPIVPLMIDLGSAREAWPEVTLPDGAPSYPSGMKRAEWHIDYGKKVFRRVFNLDPKGCWPSEGSISGATLDLFAEKGFVWSASGESVLANSLKASGISIQDSKQWLHKPYKYGNIHCFFRNDKLSDAIGFTYSTWHGDDAAANFVHEIEKISDGLKAEDQPVVVSVILDGENAWEYYPSNGYYFISSLYKMLAGHPSIEMTTFSDVLGAGQTGVIQKPVVIRDSDNRPLETAKTAILEKIIAGSWVYGTFSTWIGDPDKNLGWNMLIEAKQAYDQIIKSGRLSEQVVKLATEQLAVCEGSDWCWWFGDYNPSGSVSDFEQLYRLHLRNLYVLLDSPPPDYLTRTFTYGGGNPETGGTMRKGQNTS